MKRATIAMVAILCSTGFAFAGGGGAVPEGSQKDPPSGRPGKVLDGAACDSVWKMAAPDGDTLSQDKAAPFILNFEMVDTAKDGKISADEFKAGCANGWVQAADAATTKDMKGTPAQ